MSGLDGAITIGIFGLSEAIAGERVNGAIETGGI